MRRYSANDAIGVNVFSKSMLMFLMTTLVVLPFMAEKKIETTPNIEPKAEFLVTLDWDGHAASDLDLWFGSPDGKVISFRSKQAGFYSLAHDDLGRSNDSAQQPDGSYKVIYINQEILTMRGSMAGQYRVNVHSYLFSDDGPIDATVRLIRLNPFEILETRQLTFEISGQELSGFTFTLDGQGHLTNIGTSFATLLRRQQ